MKENSPHDWVVATIKKSPFPLYDREFRAHQVCAKDGNTLLYGFVPAPDDVDYGGQFRVVRGTARAFLQLERALYRGRIVIFQ